MTSTLNEPVQQIDSTSTLNDHDLVHKIDTLKEKNKRKDKKKPVQKNKAQSIIDYYNKLNKTRLSVTDGRKKAINKFLAEYSFMDLNRMIYELKYHSEWKAQYGGSINLTWLVRPTKYDANHENLIEQRAKRLRKTKQLKTDRDKFKPVDKTEQDRLVEKAGFI